jgi:hypothetical protein
MFACPQCGKQFVWVGRIAGTRVNCTCGRGFVAPIEAPALPKGAESSDTYDIADDPLLEELPSRTAQKRMQTPTLTYESKTSRSGTTIGDILGQLRTKSVIIPAVVVVCGITFRFLMPLFISSGGNARSGAGAALILVALLLNVTTMLLGVLIVARFTGSDLGSMPVAIARLCAVAVLGTVLFAVVTTIDNSDGSRGMIIAWHVVFLFNWIAFSFLFEMDIQESLFTVALVGLMQAGVACALWHR